MASYVGRNERQRELEKLYNKLCHRYSRYEVWQDMVVMIACAIANAVDKRYFDQREAMYMRVVKKYEKDELAVFPEFFTHIVMGMEEYPDCDFLGELYMNLELGNSYAGQFFTPYDVCRMMAQVTINDDQLRSQIEKHGWISINDCACGAGATLVAAANYLRSIGINYQMQALFVAQDVDMTVALMCYIQLSLLGCAGYVVVGNTLTEPQTGNVLFGEESSRCWYTPMYFHAVWDTRRAIAMTKSIFQRVATAIPDEAPEQPTANMGETESAGNGQEEPTSDPAPEAPDEYTPTFTISTGKKNAGQVMFDFG
ncbi:MAG: N-6 DNA methylase [Clostridia bacterium]|nr:N-6 DNA methylase [Clostridia bacterium]MBQ6121551.1 N-6 DNA methylase [Clostridia bacterium]